LSETVTGVTLITLPILFNVGFTLLAMLFDYPDVLREPTREVLGRFGARLPALGRFEPAGWKLAGQLTPIAYVLWSVWLIAVGVAVLI
jgi:hypothetical protein